MLRYTLAAMFVCCCLVAQTASAEPDADDEFSQHVAGTLRRLEEQYDTFPQRLDEQAARQIKTTVRNLIEECDSDEKAEIFCRHAYESLAQNKRFRILDYFLLWLGGRLFKSEPPRDSDTLLALVEKVKLRFSVADWEIREVLARFVAEYLSEWVPDAPSVQTKNMQIDWDDWNRLAGWIEANAKQLRFDEESKTFKKVIATQK